jgi:hypothetical protein
MLRNVKETLARQKFSHEITRLRLGLYFTKQRHNVTPLLPHLGGLDQLHVTLWETRVKYTVHLLARTMTRNSLSLYFDDKHVDESHIC